jgi:hypothetical protein
MKTQLNTRSTQDGGAIASRKKTKGKTKPMGTAAMTDTATAEADGSSSRPSYDDVAARAHAIWLAQGCPDGREKEHWQQAEEELMNGASAMTSR